MNRSSTPLPGRTDVLVIGAGVLGASVAYHLAADGTDVVVVERGEPAAGSSGKPLGGVRAHFSDPANVALGLRSLELFEDFARRPGGDVGLVQSGYLFALPTPDDVTLFERSAAVQRELGIDSRILDVAAACRLNPYLDPRRYTAAAYAPRDGWARPAAVVEGYLAAAERHGATVCTGTPVTAVGRSRARFDVRTERGVVSADTVVVCAGAWSRPVGRLLGIDLPVDPVKRQIAFTAPLGVPPPRLPFTIDFGSTYYVHNGADPGTLLLGFSEPDTPVGTDTRYDPAWEPALRAVARAATPALADAPLAGGWAGLYEMTPDHDALVGETEVDGGRVLYACGFSGHGFLQAPAVGESLADVHAGRAGTAAARGVDVSAFTVDRFAQRRTRGEANII